MNRYIILLVTLCMAWVVPLHAGSIKPRNSTDQLRKEVASFFKSEDLTFLEKNVEVVRVSFMINAKNELVIFNVSGEDPDASAYVKNVLNFKAVHFTPLLPLAKYAVDIRLVRV